MPEPKDRKELIEKLKLEIQVLEKGGYGRSVRTPWEQPSYLRDSISCLNYTLKVKEFPCDTCFLMQFVPPEHRNKQEPCHFIPLNENGDTIDSLEGKPEKLEKALLDWLRITVDRLEREEAESQTKS